MDPATQARFLESPLYRDLKTAFQHIIEEKIEDSHDVQQNEVLEPYYYITGLSLPFRGGCWCIRSQDEQCRDPESCPCKPRPFMGVNMRLAVCRRDHDEEGNCFGRYGAMRDCFDPRNVVEPYFLNILPHRSEPQTPWPQEWKERLTTIFGRYRIPDRMYNHFVNAVCALVDDMVDPFKAGNAGWVPQVHGTLGWYGQSAEHCIEELVRCMSNAWEDRHVLENPRLQRGRRYREDWDWDLE
ncbi:hypothetical protein B0J15DRAFT_581275 [Fusarium solani]|uniref:Uncharacterized protein n=1 Tax=Fusarium solani TaxID=169388 RepID=A0A9P9KMV3_FUSSL|nr:uncharacterized protein B0J15DRAFT_581275 [Fusarium solani]KAH7264345.1 hypothetical protein B0J15DRAFT_581275 [Fusarium solani]